MKRIITTGILLCTLIIFCAIGSALILPFHTQAKDIPDAADREIMPDGSDMAGTAAELKSWLSSHRAAGGTLTLSSDIMLDDDFYSFPLSRRPVTIQTGNYRIIVKGHVEIAGINLSITGHGGPNGLITITPEGYLSISYAALQAETGYTIAQQPGSILETLFRDKDVSGDGIYSVISDSMLEGAETVAWLNLPVIGSLDFLPDAPLMYAVFKRSESFDASRLPQTCPVSVNFLGRSSREQLSVDWDAVSAEGLLTARKDASLTGTFTAGQYYARFTPVCDIRFTQYGAAILNARMNFYNTFPVNLELTFHLPEGASDITLIRSTDEGITWEDVDPSVYDIMGSDMVNYMPYGSSGFSPAYFSIRAVCGDDIIYTNAISLDEDCQTADAGDCSGNRGGGTDIMNPPSLDPPETASADEASDLPDDASGKANTDAAGEKKGSPGSSMDSVPSGSFSPPAPVREEGFYNSAPDSDSGTSPEASKGTAASAAPSGPSSSASKGYLQILAGFILLALILTGTVLVKERLFKRH